MNNEPFHLTFPLSYSVAERIKPNIGSWPSFFLGGGGGGSHTEYFRRKKGKQVREAEEGKQAG